MKRDPVKSITEIRKLCVEALSNKNSHYAKDPVALLARIEWICRHCEEDYDEQGQKEKITT